jgi:hypothetical protein
MPPKKQIIAKKEEIPMETLDILEEEKTDSENEIEAPPPSTPKVKRPLTEKQKANLAKGREIAHERRMIKDLKEEKKEKLIKKQILVDETKKALEEKLIKTAVAVKKKQLLEEARLAKYTKEIEDIPDEVVKKIIREKKQPKQIKEVEREIELPPPHNPFAGYYFL